MQVSTHCLALEKLEVPVADDIGLGFREVSNFTGRN